MWAGRWCGRKDLMNPNNLDSCCQTTWPLVGTWSLQDNVKLPLKADHPEFCAQKIQILHAKKSKICTPKWKFCSQNIQILALKYCHGALNRPPRILHSENGNSALKKTPEILHSENGNSQSPIKGWLFCDFLHKIGNSVLKWKFRAKIRDCEILERLTTWTEIGISAFLYVYVVTTFATAITLVFYTWRSYTRSPWKTPHVTYVAWRGERSNPWRPAAPVETTWATC